MLADDLRSLRGWARGVPRGVPRALGMPLGLALAALWILWLGASTDLDLRLANLVFNPQTGQFPWRESWLTTTLSHSFAKNAFTLLALCVVVACAWDWLRPSARYSALRRRQLRIIAWSAILVPLVTTLLKYWSGSHCPWDLTLFGGTEPYIRLLQALPANIAPGHCLPAGHASSALWLVSFAVLWLPGRPRSALLAGALLLLPGLLLGLMQQLRGAHFLTHTLWSVWIACAVLYLLCRWMPGRTAHSRAALPPLL